MARLWLALAVCLVVLIVLVDDSDARWCGRGRRGGGWGRRRRAPPPAPRRRVCNRRRNPPPPPPRPKPCASNPCRNRGVCSDDGNRWWCVCVNGFGGTSCEKDVTPPTISCPRDMTLNTDASGHATVSYPSASANDNHGNPKVNCEPKSRTLKTGRHKITCKATDSARNEATCKYTIVVKDKTPPTIRCPGDMTLNTDASGHATVSYPSASANDNHGNPKVNCEPKSRTLNPGRHEIKCKATDNARNEATCKYTIVVKDGTPPTIECPRDMKLKTDASSDYATVSYPSASANDYNGHPTVNCVPKSKTLTTGRHDIKCTATDTARNTATCKYVVTVEDKEKPRLTCPINMESFPTPGQSTGVLEYDIPRASDNVDHSTKVTCDPRPGSKLTKEVTRVTCKTSDAAGNKESCDFEVKMIDNQEPSLTCPIDMTTLPSSGRSTGVLEYDIPRASDNVDSNLKVTCDPKPGSTLTKKHTKVTCFTSDQARNEKRCSFEVTMEDNERPRITCPINMERNTISGESYGLLQYDLPTASDNVDSKLVVKCVPIPGSKLRRETTTVKCSTSDSAGNSDRCSFDVILIDNEKPSLNCPIDMTALPTPGQSTGVLEYDIPRASDNVDSNLKVRCDPKPGTVLRRQKTRVTCHTSDRSNNDESCSFLVTLIKAEETTNIEDNEKPSLTCPIDMTALPTPGRSTGVLEYDIPRASDNVDSNLKVRCNPKPGTVLRREKTRVTCHTSDRSNNDESCSFVVTLIKEDDNTNIEDNEKPRLDCPIDMDRLTTPGSSTLVLEYDIPEASDNVDSNLKVTCHPKPGSILELGTTTIHCRTFDKARNSNRCSFDVRVAEGKTKVIPHDDEKPVLHCPFDMDAFPTPAHPKGVLEYVIPRASDNVDSNLKVTCHPKPGTDLKREKTRVTCHTSDRSNNDESCSFVVTLIKEDDTTSIEDKDKPRLICPTDMEVFAPGHSAVVLKYKIPRSSDKVTCDPKPGSMLTTCTTKVTCHTSDRAGNDQSCSFYVRKKRTKTLPEIEEPNKCRFSTTDYDDNKYEPCATPLTHNGHSGICLKLTSKTPSSVYLSIWDRQSNDFEDGMTELEIVHDEMTSAGRYKTCAKVVKGFSDGTSELCISRERSFINVTFKGRELMKIPTKPKDKTEIGFASSETVNWSVRPYKAPKDMRPHRRPH